MATQQEIRKKIVKILTNQWGETDRQCFDDAIDELFSLFTTELEKRAMEIEEFEINNNLDPSVYYQDGFDDALTQAAAIVRRGIK